jgi:hypothetical protein
VGFLDTIDRARTYLEMTVLFADVKGPMELAAQLDPDRTSR